MNAFSKPNSIISTAMFITFLVTVFLPMASIADAPHLETDELNETEESNWQAIMQLDNDLFAGSDRDYTNGIRFGFVQEVPLDSAKGKRWDRRLKNRSRQLTGRLQGFGLKPDAKLRFARGFGLSQLMFTPEDPLVLSAPDGERPYASWLGVEYSFHVKEGDHVNSLTFSVGTTGKSSLAQPTQNWVHRNISNSPIFQGWDSQVPSELTLNVHFDHKQRFKNLIRTSNHGFEVDGYYEGGLAAGNFRTDAYIGSLIRMGYRLPNGFSTPRIQLGSYSHQLFSNTNTHGNKFSAFAFAGVRATAVLHDITLDGTIFRSFDTGIESKPLVGELLWGVGLHYKNIDAVYARSLRSDEFYDQNENLEFGSFMLRFQTWFR